MYLAFGSLGNKLFTYPCASSCHKYYNFVQRSRTFLQLKGRAQMTIMVLLLVVVVAAGVFEGKRYTSY